MNDIIMIRIVEFTFYVFGLISLFILCKKNKKKRLFHFLSGFLFGITLELFSVNFTDGYFYNPNTLLNIGDIPGHFPVYGALAWGLFMALSQEVAEKFKVNKLMTGLIGYAIVMGWDFFFDIVAIRVAGGLWTWTTAAVDFAIHGEGMYGVTWTNYFGYSLVVATMSILVSLTYDKINEDASLATQLMYSIRNYAVGISFFIPAITLTLKLNSLVPWSNCILFLVPFMGTWSYIIYRILKTGLKLTKAPNKEYVVFFSGIHLLSIFCGLQLGLQSVIPLVFLCELLLFGLTISLGLLDFESVTSFSSQSENAS